MFDFFTAGALPAPVVSPAQAEAWARDVFGFPSTATELGSQQDANFLLSRDGAPVAVMKVANSAFDERTVDEQDAAAQWIADAGLGLRTSSRLGSSARLRTEGGEYVVRLLRHLDGGTLHGSHRLGDALIADMGRVAGAVSTALASLPQPPAERVLQWDARQSVRVVDLLADHIADETLRRRVREVTAREWAFLGRVAADLPVQTIHGDLTDDNLIRSTAPDGLVDGVIDFGDLMVSWRVAELATTISSVLHHAEATPLSVLPAVEAFHTVQPLTAAEIDALWPLVVLRGAVLVVSGHQQVAIDDGNAYALDGLGREQRIFDQAASVPSPVMAAIVRQRLGVARAAERIARPLPRIVPAGVAVAELDLGTTSRVLDEGAWMTDAAARRAVDDAVASLIAGGAELVVAPFGTIDATRARALSGEAPATWRTGADVWAATAAGVTAPWTGTVRRIGAGAIELDDGTLVLRVEASDPSALDGPEGEVATGAELVTLPAGVRCRFTLVAAGAGEVPGHVQPAYAPGWRDLLHDPAPLFGLDPVPSASDPGALLERRNAALAEVQEHYYRRPPRIERGWKHHLLSDDGRAYLDMVNNVTVLGHSHPRVAEAVAAQWRTFNSNSRFHYGSIVELSEKLTSLLPDPLDTVFLVNSGSEAVELALRLARAHTGRDDVVAVRESYHGWTYLADAVSTSAADNPHALETRPGWVHTVDAPNAFRGRHRGAEASRYAEEAVDTIRGLVADGTPPAAFICEPVYGSAGGVTLPEGYLRAMYAAVRAAGGLAIADEVQVGLGRLGEWFWGFEQQRVVPDIVTIAKSLGNGHPLGAVITTKDIAASYARGGYFFSSTGGSPVSSVVGSTVLDVIRDEHLDANAAEVGGYLKRRLVELADVHPIIGEVHGVGLYLGVELVRDRATLEPAVDQTREVCERMRELGVIVQPTGNDLNVLKIKPPLSFDRAAADFFVDTLDRVLAAGVG